MDHATEPEPTGIQPTDPNTGSPYRGTPYAGSPDTGSPNTDLDDTLILDRRETADTGAGDTLVLPDTTRRGAAPATPPIEREPRRWWATLIALPVGVLAALVGVAPWLLDGGRLPLQDLWATDASAADMPFVLLPFSQQQVVPIFSYLIVGATVAGIAGRALRLRGWGLALLELGVLGAQSYALVQTALTVYAGLQDRFESAMYLAGLVTGTVLSILAGILTTLLVAAAPRAGALLGLTAGAIGMTAWVGALLSPDGLLGIPFADIMWVLQWIAPVLTGIAIAWAGLNTVGRVLSTLVALAMIWVAPAVITAIGNALGNPQMFRSGAELIDYGVSVFRSALLIPGIALPPVIVAASIGAIGAGIMMVVRAALRKEPAPE